MRAIIDVNFSNQLAPDQITWLLCTSVRCDLLMDVVETFEHLECESHVGNRRQHYEFWNFGNREFGFGISRNLFHQCHPLMLHSLLHLPSFFQKLQRSSVWFAKMNFCNLPVDVQIWLALACVCVCLRVFVCGCAQKHKGWHTNSVHDETNGTWNMVMVNQRQVSDITATWLLVRTALETERKKREKHFSTKNIFAFWTVVLRLFIHAHLCSSRPRINGQIGEHNQTYHTKKKTRKKSLSQGFCIHQFFFDAVSPLLGQRQQAKKTKMKNKAVAISLISSNLKWIRMWWNRIL